MELVETILTEQEAWYYETTLDHAGIDPSTYLEGRRIRFPPEHFAEVAYAFTSYDAVAEPMVISGATEKEVNEMASHIINIGSEILVKMAVQIDHNGFSERADAAFEEFDEEWSREIPEDAPEEGWGDLKINLQPFLEDYVRPLTANMLECNCDEGEEPVGMIEIDDIASPTDQAIERLESVSGEMTFR